MAKRVTTTGLAPPEISGRIQVNSCASCTASVGGPERRDVSFRKIAAALKPQNRGIGYKRRRQCIQEHYKNDLEKT
jgi:ribosomal protein L34E